MKFLVFALVALFSTASMASGFLCESKNGVNVKLYNHVHPTHGTKNPAVLIVSTADGGTVAALKGEQLTKIVTARTIHYSGQGHDYKTGRFVAVGFRVSKQPHTSGPYAGMHYGNILINADNAELEANLACKYYLKGNGF
jgi:hypothetical protein